MRDRSAQNGRTTPVTTHAVTHVEIRQVCSMQHAEVPNMAGAELAVEHVLELFLGRIARRVALEVDLLQLRQDLVRARVRVRVGLG